MSHALPPTPPPSINPAFFSDHFHARYKITGFLGSGTSGVTYKVVRKLLITPVKSHPRLKLEPPPEAVEEVFAIKVVQRLGTMVVHISAEEWSGGTHGLVKTGGMLLVPKEAYILRRAGTHEGVINLEEVFGDSTFYYLVLEHFGHPWLFAPAPAAQPSSTSLQRTSSDLLGCIRRLGATTGLLKEYEARGIFRLVVRAVVDLKERGIAHGDLKASNVLIDARGRVKLVDFGSAHLLSTDLSNATAPASRACGTRAYLAPELLEEKNGHFEIFAVEVWALGALLHVLLTRENAFDSEQDARGGKRHMRGFLNWSLRVDEVLDGCLEVDVEKRWTLERLAECEWLGEV